jgi:hypothetical protein
METNIVGQFPILNRQKSKTDEYGFDYVTYQYVIKTDTLNTYIPKKDDVFNGIGVTTGTNKYQTIRASGESAYVVTRVEVNPLQGDLTELLIETVGTKNNIESNAPKITIRQGGPLIFGLSSNVQSEIPYGIGRAGVGLQIEIKFLGYGGNSQEINVYNTYIGKPIPASFRGVLLPQTINPFDFDLRTPIQNSGSGPTLYVGYYGFYYGYCCKTMITEARGALNLYTLTFSECGVAYRMYTPSQFQVQETTVYNFPTIG